MGRADGAPVPGMVGRSAAAPILFEAFARLGKTLVPLPHAPKAAIFAATARLPLPLQRFRPGGLPSETERPLRIMYPPNGARLELASTGGKFDPVVVKVAGGTQPLTVLVNGAPLTTTSGKRTLFYSPDGPGFVRLTVMDARGAAESVVVRVQ